MSSKSAYQIQYPKPRSVNLLHGSIIKPDFFFNLLQFPIRSQFSSSALVQKCHQNTWPNTNSNLHHILKKKNFRNFSSSFSFLGVFLEGFPMPKTFPTIDAILLSRILYKFVVLREMHEESVTEEVLDSCCVLLCGLRSGRFYRVLYQGVFHSGIGVLHRCYNTFGD